MFNSGFNKHSSMALTFATIPMAPLAGSLVAGGVHSLISKKPKTKRQQKEFNIRDQKVRVLGVLSGMGTSMYRFGKMIDNDLAPDTPKTNKKFPHINFSDSQTNKYVPRPEHPNVIRRSGNILDVDFKKPTGFARGFSKFTKKI